MPTKPTPPEPTNTEVRERLGPTYALFEALLEAHPDLEPRWKYYGPRNGWSLKLLDGKQNLCFLGPRDGFFLAAFSLGHDAVERALHSDLPPELRRSIATARSSPEGRPARVEVRSPGDLDAVEALLEMKRGGRSGGRRRGSAGHGKARAVSAGAHAATPDTPPRSAAQRRGRSPG
jgi:hypothetical protein